MSLEFHHLGVACHDLEKGISEYQSFGYEEESESFTDASIGIKGIFMIKKDAPRIELVQNLPGFTVLDAWLSSGSPMYHIAFTINESFHSFQKERGEILVFGPIPAVAFANQEVWFTLRKNRQLVEYIHVESK